MKLLSSDNVSEPLTRPVKGEFYQRFDGRFLLIFETGVLIGTFGIIFVFHLSRLPAKLLMTIIKVKETRTNNGLLI